MSRWAKIGLAAGLALGAGVAGANGAVDTVTVALPSMQEACPVPEACAPRAVRSQWFDPGLPPGAVVLSSRVGGVVDDACTMGGVAIGLGDCGPTRFDDVDITGHVDARGRFEIVLLDETDPGDPVEGPLLANEVRLDALNTIEYRVDDEMAPGYSAGDGDGGDDVGDEPCGPSDCDCGGGEQANCVRERAGCLSCGSPGSPQVSVDVTRMDVKVEDVPVRSETAVGPKLELRLGFRNSRTAATGGGFGPGWRCNWEGEVREVGGGTNVVAYPSGTEVRFAAAGAGTWKPPAALTDVLRKTNGVYLLERDGGEVLEYGAAGAEGVWRLSAVRDAWGNEVSVSYDASGRLQRAEQTVPATGRMLEFAWEGGRISSVRTEERARRTASFSYAGGRLSEVASMGGQLSEYAYEGGYLGSVRHGGRPRASISYGGRPPSAWTASNAWMCVTDGAGVSRSYRWTYGVVRKTMSLGDESLEEVFQVGRAPGRGRVVAGMGRQGRLETWTYGPGGRVAAKLDRNGALSGWSYNAMNRVTSATNASGGVRRFVYAANGVDWTERWAEDGSLEARCEWVPGRHAPASLSNASGRVTTYAYNALGLVTNRLDGRTLEEFEYDAEGRLTARRRNGVLAETNRYDAFGLRSWSRDAAGLERSWTYDALGRVTSVVTVNGNLVSVESNHWECCWMDQRTDRRGGVWNYQADGNGALEWERNPAGLTTFYAYDANGARTLASNELEWTTRAYTPEGWLRRTEWPSTVTGSSHAENRWYDAEGRLVKRQAVSGAFWKWEYDSAGRVTGEFVPDGRTLPFGVEQYVQSASNRYDACGRVAWSRDIRGLAVSNEYDAAGRLVRQAWEDGTEQRWTYNRWDQETSFTDRAGNVTSNEYDALGRRVRAIDPRGHATAWTYDDADRVTSMTDTLGQAWRYAYDAEGHVVSLATPDGAVETRLYDAAGDLLSISKNGVCTEFSYDLLGNRTSVRVGGHPLSQAAYDGLSRLVAATDAEGVRLTNAWDAWGQLAATARTGGAAETFQYGDRGLTNAVDRLGIATRTERDALGRVLRTVDGNGNAVQVAYLTNGVDQVSSLWDGNGNETRWNYDEWGLTTNKVYADGSQETYRYDLLGRLAAKLDPAGNATTFSYDANGNLAALQRGASAPFTFAYDPLNRRTNMADSVGTTAWRYDPQGRLVAESGPFGTPEVQVAYDPAGRLTNVTWGTWSVDYAFDDLGRIVSVAAPEGTYAFTYFSNGIRRATVAYPNGVTEVRAHDELARCTSLAFLSGTNPLLSIAYAYDEGDRRTNEVWSTGRAMAYAYDNAHQLAAVDAARPSDAARYRYDAAGNPVDRSELGLDITNTFNHLNQIVAAAWTGATLTAVGSVNYPGGTVTVGGAIGTIYPDKTFDVPGVPVARGTNTLTNTFTDLYGRRAASTSTVVLRDTVYTHDANGNLTSDATFTYQYDLANQLTNVTRKADGARILSCRYDALGRRVEAIRSDGTVDRYVYFPGSFLVLAVLDENNAPKELYTRGPDLSGTLSGAGGIGGILACTYASVPVLYHHADLMGNIIALTDPSGSVASTFRYTPFGQLSARTGPLLPRHLFSSKEFDRSVSLHYYGYRYYTPSLGRWLTRDPLGERASMPLYQALKNCGLRWVDSWGLWNDGAHGRPDASQYEQGHSDFPGHEIFDYTLEDYGWSNPFNPASTWRHFRSLDASEEDLKDAVVACDPDAFARFVHQMQDFFAHYGQGYRWWKGGHAVSSVIASVQRSQGYGPARPDNPVDFGEAYKAAAERTETWVKKWKGCCCRDGNQWHQKSHRDDKYCNTPPENPYGETAPPPTPEPGRLEKEREKLMDAPKYLPDGSINWEVPVIW